MSRVVSWLPWVLAVALGLYGVVHQCRDIGNFLEDDSLISLRYSERLLDGKGLTWTDGERVEGYSNLSQVLLVAALGATGLDLIDALRVFTVSGVVAAFLAIMLFARRLGAGWLGATLALVLLGTSAPIAIWTVAGLEQPLVLACLCATLWFLSEYEASGFRGHIWGRRAGPSLVLLVWTRPDSPLFVVLFAVGLVVLLGRTNLWALPRALGWVVGAPLTAWVAQLAFRLAYYGDWVPNTAHVKAHVTEARVREGLEYVKQGFQTNGLLSAAMVVALLIALTHRATRRWTLLVAVLGVAWTGYVALIGGDHFPGWRHLVPVWGLGAMAVALGFAAVKRWRRAPWLRTLLLAGALSMVPWSLQHQWQRRENAIVRVARWQWEGQAIGALFGTAFAREQPLYAVTAAGCLPYFSKLPALDMLGLNDKHIARQPADPRKQLGHDHGDGTYVLRRAPDLITFNMPRGDLPLHTSGEQMAADPSFARDYARIPFQALAHRAMTSHSYVRVKGRVGAHADSNQVVVPSYLLQPSTGLPLPEGGMGAILRKGERATWTLPDLEPGQWRIELRPPNPRVTAAIKPLRVMGTPLANESTTATLLQRAPVSLSLLSADATTVVGTVLLRRVTDTDEAVAPPSPKALGQESDLHPWTPSGEAFADLSQRPREGQTPVSGASGLLFNSFLDSRPGRSGDSATGTLTSASFVAQPTSMLRLRVGGGKAEGFDTQTGVRIVEQLPSGERRVRFVVTGERDEVLRETRLDLGWLAGRTLVVELFDEATGGWGHVLASDFLLTW